jgi:hypothetical protein
LIVLKSETVQTPHPHRFAIQYRNDRASIENLDLIVVDLSHKAGPAT